MTKKTNIESQLRNAIVSAPFLPAELARRSGVASSVISHFINGNRSVVLTTAAKLAGVLGLELVHRKRPGRKQKGRRR